MGGRLRGQRPVLQVAVDRRVQSSVSGQNPPFGEGNFEAILMTPPLKTSEPATVVC